MNSKLLILLSLLFIGLFLNSYILSQKSLEGGKQNRRFMLRDSEELFNVEWESFESLAQPSYNSKEEENYRKEIFCQNAEQIMNLNDEASGETRFTMNELSDKTQEEIQKTKLGVKIPTYETLLSMEQYEIPELQQVASTIDWRKALPPQVKNQGSCGSCWAFAAGQVLEGQRAAQNGVIQEISIQHILDCTDVANGCNGWYSDKALEMTAQKGLIKAEDHLYIARDQNSCPLKTKLPFKNKGVQYVGGDCDKLKSALQEGPIVVYLAAGAKFMSYSSGILEDLASTTNDINHAVIVVGYTPQYWIVRNSWGTGYGMKGYYHVKMGNHAQICKYAYLPTKDPQYTTVNGIKPDYTINQDSIVIDNTPKIDFNSIVDKTFSVSSVKSGCAGSLNGLSYIENQVTQMFNPQQTTIVAKIFSRIDFQVNGISFEFTNSQNKIFKLDLERSEGGKAKALGLKYGDVVYLVQCTVTKGAPQVILNQCSGKTAKDFLIYREDSKGLLNDACTFGLKQN